MLSVAVAICQEEGWLSFDDPVSKWIPAFEHTNVCTADGTLVMVHCQVERPAPWITHTQSWMQECAVEKFKPCSSGANNWQASLSGSIRVQAGSTVMDAMLQGESSNLLPRCLSIVL